MKCLVLGFCFLERLLIMVSIYLLVIDLFRFSISSWFSPGRLYASRNLLISSKLSICWYIIVHSSLLEFFVFLRSFMVGLWLSLWSVAGWSWPSDWLQGLMVAAAVSRQVQLLHFWLWNPVETEVGKAPDKVYPLELTDQRKNFTMAYAR